MRAQAAQTTINGVRLTLSQGDITEAKTEAIVNAANSRLVLGAGVAGAIRRRGGPSIQAECDRLSPVSTGSAAITGAGDLAARWVIHAVGPRQGEGREEEKLGRAVASSLALAEEKGIGSITLPAISTGVFGVPLKRAAGISLKAAWDYLAGRKDGSLTLVDFCLFGAEAHGIFALALDELFSRQTKGTY